MALSRSSHSRFQGWAIRAIAGFLVVYLLGFFGVPTLIPYVAVIIAVVIDAVRSAMRRNEPHTGNFARTDRGETIH
jgi:hypothetical protein